MTTAYARRTDVVWARLDGEVLAYSEGMLHGLDASTTLVWDVLEHPCTLQQVLSALHHTTGTSLERLSSDVEAVLVSLQDRGLVTTVTQDDDT